MTLQEALVKSGLVSAKKMQKFEKEQKAKKRSDNYLERQFDDINRQLKKEGIFS